MILIALYGVVICLLVWVFRQVPLGKAIGLLQRMPTLAVVVWCLLNGVIFALMSVRWWWFLYAMGQPIRLIWMMIYRLVGFGISYFTPGTQFGGEPAQVWLVSQRHTVKVSIAVAALAFDRLIDILASFVVLLICLLLATPYIPLLKLNSNHLWGLVAFILLGIGLYLQALARKRQPLTYLTQHSFLRKFKHSLSLITESEKHMVSLFAQQPGAFWVALLITMLQWVLMVVEFWLTFVLLGTHLTFSETMLLLALVRVAFLLPAPGALGALEAGLFIGLQQILGLSPELPIATALLIRLRDTLLGGIGLVLSVPLLGKWQKKA
ncbi:MAG TPA: lysylphosphatidylglycerol synthase transmembrane domain-containing protein [Anaerolineales bacterium]|nr:lysylphosphatidylglycerol synthase transmembrane domain-containing protein [Anaerolineales bacterium]